MPHEAKRRCGICPYPVPTPYLAPTKRYNLTYLMYYEHHRYITDAIIREKVFKKEKRPWKDALIKSMNESLLNPAADWDLPDMRNAYNK